MNLRLALLTFLLPTALTLAQSAPATAPSTTSAPSTQPHFTLGKDTTRISAPLLPDGRPDYVTYMDQTLSKGVTPENNAVVALLEVFGTDPKSNVLTPKIHDEALKRLGIKDELPTTYHSLADYFKKHDIKDDTIRQEEETLARKHPWGADQYPDIAHWLDENDQALDRIATAAARPHYYWPWISTNQRAPMLTVILPGLGHLREAANALTTRTMLRLDQGKIKESQADLLAVHRLARLTSQGPTLIEKLVGVAIETIAARGDVELAGALQPDQANAALAELAQLPPLGAMADAVDQAERLEVLDCVLSVSKYGTSALASVSELSGDGESPLKFDVNTADVNWDTVLKKFNVGYDRLVAAMRLPTHAERAAATAALDQDIQKMKSAATTATAATDPTDHMADLLMAIVFPSLGRARELADRAQQRSDLASLALALAAFHGDHNTYPDTLAELAPNYLKSIPQDLFSDEPLKYHKQGPGYLLYSIGPDLKDDNGAEAKNDSTGDMAVKMLK